MKKKISGFENLIVYQKLCELHLEISELTFKFPEFELHEIGSKLRKSTNSAPACIAEGYSNKHIKFYIEKITQALGEVRQTKHYLNIALKKSYIEELKYDEFIAQYDECNRMLKDLVKSLSSFNSRNNVFTKNQYRDNYHP